MAVVRLLDRLDTQVKSILESRAAPEDAVEWAMTIVPVEEVCGEDDEGVHIRRDTALSFYAALACPEVESRSIAHVVVPIEWLDEDQVEDWVNQVWDHLVVNRMRRSSGLDEDDFDGFSDEDA